MHKYKILRITERSIILKKISLLNTATTKHPTNINKGRYKKLYCICKKPYDPLRDMIGCDICYGWFHYSCVGITMQEAFSKTNYICPKCSKIENNLSKIMTTKTQNPILSTYINDQKEITRSSTDRIEVKQEVISKKHLNNIIEIGDISKDNLEKEIKLRKHDYPHYTYLLFIYKLEKKLINYRELLKKINYLKIHYDLALFITKHTPQYMNSNSSKSNTHNSFQINKRVTYDDLHVRYNRSMIKCSNCNGLIPIVTYNNHMLICFRLYNNKEMNRDISLCGFPLIFINNTKNIDIINDDYIIKEFSFKHINIDKHDDKGKIKINNNIMDDKKLSDYNSNFCNKEKNDCSEHEDWQYILEKHLIKIQGKIRNREFIIKNKIKNCKTIIRKREKIENDIYKEIDVMRLNNKLLINDDDVSINQLFMNTMTILVGKNQKINKNNETTNKNNIHKSDLYKTDNNKIETTNKNNTHTSELYIKVNKNSEATNKNNIDKSELYKNDNNKNNDTTYKTNIHKSKFYRKDNNKNYEATYKTNIHKSDLHKNDNNKNKRKQVEMQMNIKNKNNKHLKKKMINNNNQLKLVSKGNHIEYKSSSMNKPNYNNNNNKFSNKEKVNSNNNNNVVTYMIPQYKNIMRNKNFYYNHFENQRKYNSQYYMNSNLMNGYNNGNLYNNQQNNIRKTYMNNKQNFNISGLPKNMREFNNNNIVYYYNGRYYSM